MYQHGGPPGRTHSPFPEHSRPNGWALPRPHSNGAAGRLRKMPGRTPGRIHSLFECDRSKEGAQVYEGFRSRTPGNRIIQRLGTASARPHWSSRAAPCKRRSANAMLAKRISVALQKSPRPNLGRSDTGMSWAGMPWGTPKRLYMWKSKKIKINPTKSRPLCRPKKMTATLPKQINGWE